jgi:hypothetical protein|tara:strand:- start:255 stop:419 length:165 start_codon:yes stop_codon:yes gene_type:complete
MRLFDSKGYSLDLATQPKLIGLTRVGSGTHRIREDETQNLTGLQDSINAPGQEA